MTDFQKFYVFCKNNLKLDDWIIKSFKLKDAKEIWQGIIMGEKPWLDPYKFYMEDNRLVIEFESLEMNELIRGSF